MAQAQFLPCRRYTAKLGMLLVLALVFAQAGALVHGYSHAHGAPSQACSDCLSFAPLLAAAGGAANTPTLTRARVGTTYRRIVAPLVGQTPQLSFRSRAPPFLV